MKKKQRRYIVKNVVNDHCCICTKCPKLYYRIVYHRDVGMYEKYINLCKLHMLCYKVMLEQ